MINILDKLLKFCIIKEKQPVGENDLEYAKMTELQVQSLIEAQNNLIQELVNNNYELLILVEEKNKLIESLDSLNRNLLQLYAKNSKDFNENTWN